jgi:hypothetical protein
MRESPEYLCASGGLQAAKSGKLRHHVAYLKRPNAHPIKSEFRSWKGEYFMERKLTFAEIILIAGTRVALGMGIGLLVSGRLNDDQRRSAGLTLTLVGGLTTIPLAINLISRKDDVNLEQIREAA